MTSVNITRRTRRIAAPALALLALPLIAASIARAADTLVPDRRTAVLSVRDLDLPTTEGQSIARERIQTLASTLCSRLSDHLDLDHTAHFQECVARTTDQAMRQLVDPSAARASSAPSGASIATKAPNAEPARRAHVSLTDLDLSTSEGVNAARTRAQEAVQRLCSQVADELDLSHKANFDRCVDENMSKAQVGIQELAAKKSVIQPLLGSNR